MEDKNKNYDLLRFTSTQQLCFSDAYTEIKKGKKTTHWIWFIFPQLKELAKSTTSEYYGITSFEEAKAFLDDDYLGGNLRKITSALLELEENDISQIMSKVDCIKLKSSMTLFALVTPDEELFRKVLDKYYGGEMDYRTVEIISKMIKYNDYA